MPYEIILKTQHIFNGRGMTVRVDTVLTPKGRTTTREVVERENAVIIIPVDKNGNLLMVRQYRHSIGQELLELPAGMVEPGESPEECARRELQEEIGFLPLKLEKIYSWYVAPGFCNEYMHLFLAGELTSSKLLAEDTDQIKVESISLQEALHLIDTRLIQDGKTIAGILLYQRNLEKA